MQKPLVVKDSPSVGVALAAVDWGLKQRLWATFLG